MSEPLPDPRPAAKTARRAAAKAAVKAPAQTAAKTAAKRAARPARKAARQASAKTASASPKAAALPATKPAKIKLVRDSFTMPEQDHALISQLKKRALAGAHAAKKSEVLRAALHLLASLSDDELLVQLRAVPAVKTGRPRSRK